MIIDCLMSFHLMISFCSYLAPSLFFPFLKCLCVLIPQLEVKTMRVESHCVFLLVRDQEICSLPGRGQRHRSKAKPLFKPHSQRQALQESCMPRSALRFSSQGLRPLAKLHTNQSLGNSAQFLNQS